MIFNCRVEINALYVEPKTKDTLKNASSARRFEYMASAYDAKVGMWKSIEYLHKIGIQ